MSGLASYTPNDQLRRLAPELRQVFEKLGIATVASEPFSLRQVCQANGLDVETVERLLAAFQSVLAERPTVAVELMELTDLCDHVENAHHADLRDGLENLDEMTRAATENQAAPDPQILKIREIFVGFRQKILNHLRIEEESLFPLLRELESHPSENSATMESVQLTMQRMEREHGEIEEEFDHLCAMTQGETSVLSPTDPLRILHDAVVGLEQGINEQIYKENQILFPRSRAMSRGR